MDLSKFKVDAYDILALVIPGLLVICEAWATARGWTAFSASVASLKGPQFTLLLLISFATGHLVQELTDASIKVVKGDRYFKQARDEFWKQAKEGSIVRKRISSENAGALIEDVDVGFNYCLTRVQPHFGAKRDLFIANADFSRSLVLVSLLASGPAARVIFELHYGWLKCVFYLLLVSTICVGLMRLCWRRMMRFREQADSTVFHAYLAMPKHAAEVTTAPIGR
jgi:hypothetical protein